MRFLVTGGAGFIGSNLVEELFRYGDVRVIDDLSTGNIENIEPLMEKGVEFFRKSILDYDDVLKATEDIDFVFHEAALASVSRSIEDPITSNDVNVKGTLNVLEASRENGVKKLVYATSSSIYGDSPALPKVEDMKAEPKSPYAVSKLAAENYCTVYTNIYNFPTVCLRYFNVYGPKQDPNSEYSAVIPKFINQIIRGEPPQINGDGTITRDFIYVKDITQLNIKSMKKDVVGIYNAACGTQTSLNELAQLIMDITGKEVKIKYGPNRPGDVMHSYADISKAGKTLDYEPRYEIIKGLKETIEWYHRKIS